MPAIPLTLGWDAVVSPHTPLWQRSLGVDIVSGFWRPPALHVLLPTGIHGARRRGWCHLSSLQPLSPPALSSKQEVSPAKRQQIFPQSLENTIFFFTQKSPEGSPVRAPLRTVLLSPGVSLWAACAARASPACRVGCRSCAAREPPKAARQPVRRRLRRMSECIIQHRGAQ